MTWVRPVEVQAGLRRGANRYPAAFPIHVWETQSSALVKRLSGWPLLISLHAFSTAGARHPLGRRTVSALACLPGVWLARTEIGALLEGWADARSLGTRPAWRRRGGLAPAVGPRPQFHCCKPVVPLGRTQMIRRRLSNSKKKWIEVGQIRQYDD